jgi:WD40 repeat protein
MIRLLKDNTVLEYNREGELVRQKTVNVPESHYNAEFTQDGVFLMSPIDIGEIEALRFVNTITDETFDVTAEKGQTITQWDVSPNNEYVFVFVQVDESIHSVVKTMRTNTVVFQRSSDTCGPHAAAWSPDSSLVAFVQGDNELVIVNVIDLTEVHRSHLVEDILSMVFCPRTGRLVLVFDETITVFDPWTSTIVGVISGATTHPMVRISAQGEFIAVYDRNDTDSRVRIFDIVNCVRLETLRFDSPIESVTFSPTLEFVFVVTENGIVYEVRMVRSRRLVSLNTEITAGVVH